jgi:thioredoxin reductase
MRGLRIPARERARAALVCRHAVCDDHGADAFTNVEGLTSVAGVYAIGDAVALVGARRNAKG